MKCEGNRDRVHAVRAMASAHGINVSNRQVVKRKRGIMKISIMADVTALLQRDAYLAIVCFGCTAAPQSAALYSCRAPRAPVAARQL